MVPSYGEERVAVLRDALQIIPGRYPALAAASA